MPAFALYLSCCMDDVLRLNHTQALQSSLPYPGMTMLLSGARLFALGLKCFSQLLSPRQTGVSEQNRHGLILLFACSV